MDRDLTSISLVKLVHMSHAPRVHATCVYMHHKIHDNLRGGGGQAVMEMAMYATPHASTTAN